MVTKYTHDFWNLIDEMFPMFIVALFLCLIFGWSRIKESYYDHSLYDWIIQYTITAIATAVFAIAMVLILPVIFPDLSYEGRVGIMLYICVFGVKTFQSLIRKHLGLEIVDKNMIKPLDSHTQKI